MMISHEYNSTGWHRLVLVSGKKRVEGEWTSYQGIAQLQFEGRAFICVTDYHANADPTNGPIRLIPNIAFEILDARQQ